MRLKAGILFLLVLSVLLAPAGSADRPGESIKEKNREAARSEKSTEPAAKPAAAAIPAAAKPSSSSSNYTPKVELFGGFSYLRLNTNSGVGGPPPTSFVGEHFDNFGGIGSLAYNINDWLGLAGDFSGHKVTSLPSGVSGNIFTYLFGPRFSYRKKEGVTPFAHALLGGAHVSSSVSSGTTSTSSFFGTNASENAFAMALGGGVDVKLNKLVAVRMIQADYLFSKFSDNHNDRQNNVRISTGVVFRLGGSPPPPPPNHPPTAACSADVRSVIAGAGDSVSVRAQATDPDNDPLTYAWSASGGKVDGNGPAARWSSAGLGPGDYTVTARVDDGRGGTASCSATIRVDPPPNRPPVMACSAERGSVMAGERVGITATASDPDNDPLTYSWRTNGGLVVGSGKSVQLDTTGLAPGTYTVSGRVDDGRGGAADCTSAIEVKVPPPPPQASKLNECFFRAGSARVDNVCKRILDDVALRLKSEPRSSLGIVSFTDEKEAKGEKLARDRGANTVKYLGEKGVDASRIMVHTGTGQKGAGKQNRRTDLIFVPEGASF